MSHSTEVVVYEGAVGLPLCLDLRNGVNCMMPQSERDRRLRFRFVVLYKRHWLPNIYRPRLYLCASAVCLTDRPRCEENTKCLYL